MKEVFDLIANRINDAYKEGYQAGLRMAEKPYFAVGDEIMLRSECDDPDRAEVPGGGCDAEKDAGGGRMSRLDKAISDVAFILDNLILLRQIQSKGNCNTCKNRDCGYVPKPGQMVRYNCPFFKAESEVQDADSD